jgi:hypothetical protein
MTTLTCPKCRQSIPDDALDAGQCPACGFPLDGPLAFATTGARSGTRLFVAAGVVALVAGAGFAGYTLFSRTNDTNPEVADREPIPPLVYVAPMPHEPKRSDSDVPPNPPPAPIQPGMGDKEPPQPPPEPVVVEVPPPKKDGPRPLGVKIAINPKIEPKRHFDNPDDTAALPDLNSNDRVVLTGRVRVLQIGSVNGKGSVDASGLVAEEVKITGDLNSDAVVIVNTPGGKVMLGGFVAGSSKLTIRAPGGTVALEKSGRCTGGSTVTITAKRFEAIGLLTGGTKVNITFTAGGSLKLTRAEEGATVTYKKNAPTDPAPVIEKGDVRGGAKVLEGK